MLSKAIGSEKTKKVKMTVADAMKTVIDEESNGMLDEEKMVKKAIKLVENDGIVFIDEIDKIAARGGSGGGKEISREGVQRDLLPLIEGTTITTKYGQLKTDHILFICSGAFHLAKPSDLLPELQGRLPIRVELNPLSKDDLLRILKDTATSLPIQYSALLKTEGVELEFTDSGLEKIADFAYEINARIENIGARRLQTIIEKVLEEVSFSADELVNQRIIVDKKFVEDNFSDIKFSNDSDLSKFIL